jgi:hypothetical protein
MIMTSLRLVFVLLWTAACNTTGLPTNNPAPSPDLARAPEADLGQSSPVPTSCNAREKCSCGLDSSCTVVVQPCWCGPDECGNGACVCGGGAYVGCAPAGCPSVLTCPLAQLPTTPDADGCYRCRPSAPTSCEAAKSHLAATCGFGNAYLAGLSCQSNTACITRCLNEVQRCEDVGCDWCTVCDCGRSDSPLSRCVHDCLPD